MIELVVHRWFCDTSSCARRTLVEQVEGLTARYARHTPLLRAALEQIAIALAGRAGARLAGALHITVSRSTLLRLVMGVPDPPVGTLRALEVDDFALRRGQHYGTVLIDCESGMPVDLLEGRDAAPLADWLAAHSGVEVICRDRSGAYAEGAAVGAPQAVQVADRYHLWANLGQAVERCVAAHRGCLAVPASELDDKPPLVAVSPSAAVPEPMGKFAERAQRHHAMVHRLLADEHPIRAIARHLGWGRHTVQRYARAATWTSTPFNRA